MLFYGNTTFKNNAKDLDTATGATFKFIIANNDATACKLIVEKGVKLDCSVTNSLRLREGASVDTSKGGTVNGTPVQIL